jgi:signal transduction histidine kinase/CheY-like chemotaxis protein
MSNKEKGITGILFSRVFSEEDEKKILGSYLKMILFVAVIILPVYVILKIIESGSMFPADFIILGMETIFLFLLFIINKGKVRLAGILLLLTAWTALTLMAAYADGIKDIAIVGYILIIFLATLFTGLRFAFIITILSITAVWFFAIFQSRIGILPVGDTPLNYGRDYTVLFIIVLTSIFLFAKSYRYAFNRINSELNERKKTEKKLSLNEIILKESNEELNRRNIQMEKMNEDLIAAKDKAEESDRLKTAFLQNISHEIRTPMNGIVGFVNLLQQPESESAKKTEYIDIIKTCTNQLAGLVNDLIDISKIESGTLELLLTEFEADKMLIELEHNFLVSAREKGDTLTFTNDLGSSRIRSDYGKINQVLNNLISNAIKFTQDGSVTIKISRSQSNLIASVTDTGIGIKGSYKNAIFNRFRQEEVGLARNFGGSGLGLAISKGNVDFLGGEIWFESKPGKGSVFTFSIPVDFLTDSTIPEDHNSLSGFNRKLKILAAEDDEINYLYIKELLGNSNCEIVWANNGFKAVEIIRKSPDFDIILMDLKMPGMDGYEATQKIKDISPDVPVIAVTAFSLKEDIKKATGISFDGYINKPVEKADLLKKINKLVI